MIDMNETKLTTLEHLRRFLAGTAEVVFQPGRDDERYEHIADVLRRFQYIRPNARARAWSCVTWNGRRGLFPPAADPAHRPVPGRTPAQGALSAAPGGLNPYPRSSRFRRKLRCSDRQCRAGAHLSTARGAYPKHLEDCDAWWALDRERDTEQVSTAGFSHHWSVAGALVAEGRRAPLRDPAGTVFCGQGLGFVRVARNRLLRISRASARSRPCAGHEPGAAHHPPSPGSAVPTA